MTTTYTQTYNRDDIRRVYAHFVADYRIVAEYTGLHSAAFVAVTIEEIRALAEGEYLKEVHLQLKSPAGNIKKAAVWRVSTDASGWSSDRPGDLYWDTSVGDGLILIVSFTPKWKELTPEQREALLPGWGTTKLEGSYIGMTSSADRQYSSRAYGLERTRYSA